MNIRNLSIQKTYLKIYRGFGFFLLLSLLGLIVWYIFLIFLFLSNRSWAMPLTLSTTQEKVIWNFAQILSLEKEVNSLKLNKENQTGELALKKRELEANQIMVGRIEASLLNQAKTQKAEAQMLKKEMSSLHSQLGGNKATDFNRGRIDKLQKELKAGLITKEQASNYITNQYDTLYKIHQSNNEIRTKMNASETLSGGALSANAIFLESQRIDSIQKADKVSQEISSLENTLKLTENSIKDYSHVIDGFYDNMYYDAKDGALNAVFVPYDNIENLKAGSPVYACALKVVFCSKVGVVSKVYGAEETSFHYLFKTEIKGKFASVNYDDESYANSGLVFIGRKPLFF